MSEDYRIEKDSMGEVRSLRMLFMGLKHSVLLIIFLSVEFVSAVPDSRAWSD